MFPVRNHVSGNNSCNTTSPLKHIVRNVCVSHTFWPFSKSSVSNVRLNLIHSQHLQMTDLCELNIHCYWGNGRQVGCGRCRTLSEGLCCVNSNESLVYLQCLTRLWWLWPLKPVTIYMLNSCVKSSLNSSAACPFDHFAYFLPSHCLYICHFQGPDNQILVTLSGEAVCMSQTLLWPSLAQQDPIQIGISPTVVGCVTVTQGTIKHISHVSCLSCV